MEEQTLEVIGEIAQTVLGRAPLDPMVRMNRPMRFYWWAKICSTGARMAGLRALARVLSEASVGPVVSCRWMWEPRSLPARLR